MKTLVIFNNVNLNDNNVNVLVDNFINEKLVANNIIRINSGYVDKTLVNNPLSIALKLIMKTEWSRKFGVYHTSPTSVHLEHKDRNPTNDDMDLAEYSLHLHDNGDGDRMILCIYKNSVTKFVKSIVGIFEGDEKVLHSYLMTLSLPYKLTQY